MGRWSDDGGILTDVRVHACCGVGVGCGAGAVWVMEGVPGVTSVGVPLLSPVGVVKMLGFEREVDAGTLADQLVWYHSSKPIDQCYSIQM